MVTRAARSPGDTSGNDAGTIALEFVVIAMGILVPLLFVALAVMHTTGAAMATSQAARSAARAFSDAATPAQALRFADAAARLTFADHGLTLPPDALRVSCDGECLAPGSRVMVEITWRTSLPLVGTALTVPLHSRQDLQIDDLRPDAS